MNDPDVTALTISMMRASSLVRATRRDDLAAVPGLESHHLELLDSLARGPRPISWLAELHHVELSTASRRISRLVELGLVVKVTDPQDRRVQRARLTDRGSATVARLQGQRERAVARIVGSWEPDERATLGALLAKMAAQLDQGRDRSA